MALLGLCFWCVWRFFKKKRPKDKKKNKEGKVVEGVSTILNTTLEALLSNGIHDLNPKRYKYFLGFSIVFTSI